MAKISSSYLPPDIIETILSRLSVKPLLRFKSVSKSWNSIISDPLFHKIHHQKSLANLFIWYQQPISGVGVFTVVKLEDQKLQIVQQLESPSSDCTYFICHSQGVLLLTDGSRKYALWNPSTRAQTTFSIQSRCDGASYGICHDPTTDNITVVIVRGIDYLVVSSCKYKSLTMERKKFNPYTYCEPYIGPNIIHRRDGVCVDGAIYWSWMRHYFIEIIYYDPRDNKFKILQKPKNVEDSKYIYLVDLGGYLCLYCTGQHRTTVKMWIKKKGIDESSWNEFITIENTKMDISCFVPQCLMGNKIVIRNKKIDKLVVYSPLEKTFELFGEMEFGHYDPGLIPYLVST